MTTLRSAITSGVAVPGGVPSADRISPVAVATDRDALDALLLEYYGVIVGKLAAAGAPGGDTPAGLKASFWPNLHWVLPPTGQLLLAHGGANRLVGCATLQPAGPDAGEVKRLYFRPEANGNGRGRRLVTAQMAAALSRGWRRVVVNILKSNTGSIRIFEALGFRYIDRYPDCVDPVELDPWFVYMQRDLP